MNVRPSQARPIWPSRLLAVTLVAGLAVALTTTLILIADYVDLPYAQAAVPLTLVYTCGPYPLQPTSWSSSCAIPRFNPALGTLAGVQFTNTVGISSTIVVENLSVSSTVTFNGVLTGTLRINHPTTPGQLLGSGNVVTTASSILSTYDGMADFGGTSGRTYLGTTTRTSSFTVTTGLAPWIGATGSVTMPLTATSQFNCVVNPAGNSLCGSIAEASAFVTVTYLYNTPDISVTKTHRGNFVVGSNGVYTLAVRNVGLGPTIGPITATDALPAGLSYVSFSGSGWSRVGPVGSVLTFTRSNALAAGATSNIILTVGVANPAIGTVTNTVSVTTTRDLVPTNNATTDPTTVLAGVDLSIVKTESRDPITATNSLSYTLSVSNAGPSTAPSVTVTDTLPTGTTYQSASGTGWNCTPGGGSVTCTRPTNLPVGPAPNIVITVRAPDNGGVITNTAAVGSGGFDFVAGNNTATVTTTVMAISDLSISKSDSPDPVYAGATLTYTLNVANNGPSLANNVIVTDTLPAGVTYLGASGAGWSCNPSGGDVTCTRSSLAVGAAPPLILTVTTPGTTPLPNAVTVSSDAVDLNPGNNTASASTTVNPTANLSISKSDAPDPVVAGSPLTYTLSVTNFGPNATTSVRVTDTLPAGATFVGVVPSGWGCGQSGGVVTCTLASLVVGAAPDIVINTQAPGASGVSTNTASVSSALPDLTPANNSTSITTTVAGALADLSISKSDDPDPVNIGSPLTYTLHITNTGPNPAAAVRVTDALPSGVAVASVSAPSWTCGLSGGVVTCTMPSLAVGAAPDIVIYTTAPVISGTIANIAAVNSPVTDPNPFDNSTSALTTVYSLADLAITKKESADPVTTNATLTYTLSVTNTGPNTATSVRVVDTLPTSVTFVGVSGSGWSCAQASRVVTCTLASLVAGPAPNIVITVTTPALAQTITNTATVASPLTDLNLADNSSTVSTVVSPADLVISKSDGLANAVPGTTITYTIVVTNSGPGAVTGAVVSDTFPASLSGASWTCTPSGGSTCPASGSGNISTTVNLADGGVVTFHASGQVASGASGTLANTATVAPPVGGADPDLSNNTATDTDTLLPQADLMLGKTDLPDPLAVGNFLRYKITVTNTGPSNATNVVVTETLSSVTFDTAIGNCAESGGALICDLGTMPPGTSKTVTLFVIPTAAGALVNTATVTSSEFDPTPSNNTQAETTSVTGFAEVSISKTDGVDAVTAGGPVTYTITVTNGGPQAVVGATVTDMFPASLTAVTWTCAASGGSSCPASGSGNITATVNVAAGGAVTFTAYGTVSLNATGTLANTATVTVPSSVTETNTGDNSATDTDTVVGVPVTGGILLYLPLIMK